MYIVISHFIIILFGFHNNSSEACFPCNRAIELNNEIINNIIEKDLVYYCYDSQKVTYTDKGKKVKNGDIPYVTDLSKITKVEFIVDGNCYELTYDYITKNQSWIEDNCSEKKVQDIIKISEEEFDRLVFDHFNKRMKY